MLVPWAGIEPASSLLEVQSLNHWTAREVLLCYFYAWLEEQLCLSTDRKHRTGLANTVKAASQWCILLCITDFLCCSSCTLYSRLQSWWNSLYWDTYGISETLRQWDNLYMNIMHHIVNFIPKKILLIVPDWWWKKFKQRAYNLSHKKRNVQIQYL